MDHSRLYAQLRQSSVNGEEGDASTPSPRREKWISAARLRAIVLRRKNREDIHAIAVLVLAISLLLVGTNFLFRLGSKTIFGPLFGADFATLYNAGKIYNSGAHDRIYDVGLQRQLFPDLFPGSQIETCLPYSRSPFLLLLFSPLARIRYDIAYFLWMLLSAGLFWLGFHLLWGTLKRMPEENYWTGLLAAASFMPFIVESFAGGQTSALGFFSLAVAIALERRGRFFLGGLALSLLCYQPSLLILLLPMVVITKRTRMLDGFIVGAAGWSGLSWLLVGKAGCIAYVKTLGFFLVNSIGEAPDFRLWKYIDVLTFLRLLLGRHGVGMLILSLGVLLGVLLLLIKQWIGAERRTRNYQSMLWATAITWTLALGGFVGTYDATLLILSVLLTMHVFLSRSSAEANVFPPVFQLLAAMVYVVSWIAQPVAKSVGVQLFTVALLALGGYQFYVTREMRRQSVARAGRLAEAEVSLGG